MLIFSTLFVWLSEHAKTSLANKSLLTVAFFIIWVPSAIRYGVGTDFFSYYDIFNYQYWVTKNEYGFHFINYIIRSLGLSAQWAIAAYAFIFTFFAYLAYPKKHKWLFHFLFISMVLFSSFNIIRQAISLSIIAFAIKSETESKSLRSFVLIALATLFHQSAMFMFVVVLFSRLSIANSIKFRVFPAIIISLSLMLWFGPSFVQVIEMLAIKFNLPYLHYFESSYFETVRISTGYLVMAKVIVLLVMIANTKEVIKKSDKNWLIVLCAGLYAVTYSLASQSAAFGRLSYVFIPGTIFFVFIYVTIFFKKNVTYLLLTTSVIFLYSLPYFLTAISSNDYESDNHYRTTFNKDL